MSVEKHRSTFCNLIESYLAWASTFRLTFLKTSNFYPGISQPLAIKHFARRKIFRKPGTSFRWHFRNNISVWTLKLEKLFSLLMFFKFLFRTFGLNFSELQIPADRNKCCRPGISIFALSGKHFIFFFLKLIDVFESDSEPIYLSPFRPVD